MKELIQKWLDKPKPTADEIEINAIAFMGVGAMGAISGRKGANPPPAVENKDAE